MGRSLNRLRMVLLATLGGVLLMAAGCIRWAQQPPGMVQRIAGVAAVSYDGLDLTIQKEAEGAAAGWTMIGPLGPADVVVLRPGKEFAFTDGTKFFTVYRVVRVDEHSVTFRKSTRISGVAAGEANRETSSLVSVIPYEK